MPTTTFQSPIAQVFPCATQPTYAVWTVTTAGPPFTKSSTSAGMPSAFTALSASQRSRSKVRSAPATWIPHSLLRRCNQKTPNNRSQLRSVLPRWSLLAIGQLVVELRWGPGSWSCFLLPSLFSSPTKRPFRSVA